MRRFVLFFLVLAALLVLAACGGGGAAEPTAACSAAATLHAAIEYAYPAFSPIRSIQRPKKSRPMA